MSPRLWSARQQRKELESLEQGGGGGGSPGSPIVRKFPFAFNAPNLRTGHAVYTPAIGDTLLDAWIEIVTAWDGAGPAFAGGPVGDVGTFTAGKYGLFAMASTWDLGVGDPKGALAMSNAPDGPLSSQSGASAPNNFGDSTLRGLGNASLRQLMSLQDVMAALALNAIPPSSSNLVYDLAGSYPGSVVRVLPARFTTADPIKVCVSQDGSTTGADPGSTQGQAVLYLVTATPV